MNRKSTIIIIAFDFYGKGAVSVGARQQAAALIEAGYRVVAVTDRIGHDSFFDAEQSVGLFMPAKAWSRPIPRLGMAGRELTFAFGCLLTLRKLLKQETIALVLNQISTACFAVELLCRKRKIPTAFVIRSLMQERLKTGANPYNRVTTLLYLSTNRFAVKQSSRCVAVSQYMRCEAIALGANPNRIKVIYNPVDMSLFQSHPATPRDIDILYVGRLSPEKGVNILLSSLRHLDKAVRVVVIGDGPNAAVLRELASQTGKGVEFLGWIDNNQLPSFISRARIQAVPSFTEACPRSVVEALACGTPVVASRVGGIPELVEENISGWLVPPRDPEALGEVLNRLLADDQLLHRARDAARRRAQQFSMANHNREFVDFCKHETMISEVVS